MNLVIYWAAPLFTQAERIWNRVCVEELRRRGYRVILPQDEAADLINSSSGVDAGAIAERCFDQVVMCDVLVAVLDGADSDSGTSVEVGIKVARKRDIRNGYVIGVRTDFRSSEDRGLNAMFRLMDEVIYFHSSNESPVMLCDQIDEAIEKSRQK